MKKTTKKFGYNIEKFSFGQLTSNVNGKTSATGTAGVYMIAIGGICFLLGCIDRMFINSNVDIITQSIIFSGIGAGLLGYRKSKEGPLSQGSEEIVDGILNNDVSDPEESNEDSEDKLQQLNS